MVQTYKVLSDSDTKFSAQWFDMTANRPPTRQSRGLNNLVPRRGNHEFRRESVSATGWWKIGTTYLMW
jgi:hypothetical protein